MKEYKLKTDGIARKIYSLMYFDYEKDDYTRSSSYEELIDINYLPIIMLDFLIMADKLTEKQITRTLTNMYEKEVEKETGEPYNDDNDYDEYICK